MTGGLVTAGEAMLRLSVLPGSRLEDAAALDLWVAGAELNVAVGVARMGHEAAWLSRLPDSALGRRVAAHATANGVDTSLISWHPGGRVGLYFVEHGVPPRRTEVIYDRSDSCAAAMSPDDVSPEIFEGVAAVQISGITPALSTSCRRFASSFVDTARDVGTSVVVDINYRAKLWPPAEAAGVLAELCGGADVVVVTEEDAAHLFSIAGPPTTTLAALRDHFGCEHIVMTRGAQGAAYLIGGQHGEVPAFESVTVDQIGAGDAFTAGVITGLLEGDLRRGVELGNAMAALTLGVHGDHFRFRRDDVDRVLSGDDRRVGR